MKLQNLEPKAVFKYFEDLCGIPHGSGNMEAISAYCIQFAKDRGLWVYTDELHNVVIKKPGTAGYEDHPAVIIQGHLDMVCEKDPDVEFDFMTDGLRLGIDGDDVYAEGTTLGGDNCIAVAMALAILDADDIPHPPIEAVFTTDEETGMYGAAALDTSVLEGKLLINADSEEEGVLTVGCAGGARADIVIPLTKAAVTAPCYDVTVSGLVGGHSGVEIHTGRHNANVVMGRFIKALPADVQVIAMAGGQKDNVIPSFCACTLATNGNPADFVADFLAANHNPADPDLRIEVKAAVAAETGFDAASTAKLADFLLAVPNGVQAMSPHIEGLVETSLNLGVLSTADDGLHVSFSVRSSVGKSKFELLDKLAAIAADFGGTYGTRSHYPAWEYRTESRLRDTMVQVYREQFGKEAQVVAIHAGLECGLFCDKIADLDAVSFGPNMKEIHTSRERLSISSTARTYQYLCDVLKAL